MSQLSPVIACMIVLEYVRYRESFGLKRQTSERWKGRREVGLSGPFRTRSASGGFPVIRVIGIRRMTVRKGCSSKGRKDEGCPEECRRGRAMKQARSSPWTLEGRDAQRRCVEKIVYVRSGNHTSLNFRRCHATTIKPETYRQGAILASDLPFLSISDRHA